MYQRSEYLLPRRRVADRRPGDLTLARVPDVGQHVSASHPWLAGSFRVIAPDYPGFDHSSMPDHKDFAYTFESLTNVVDQLVGQLNLDRVPGHLIVVGGGYVGLELS
jgi:pimeloyl-ACP methyl ester carboxylesterase